MNDILKDGELVESDEKVAEMGLVDEKNDILLRERLDKFLAVCMPDVEIYAWQKDMILEIYRFLKDHPDNELLGRVSFRVFPYWILATLFRSMYDVDETLLQRTDED